MLARREVLTARPRLESARTAGVAGALAGFAAGYDLLAARWALTLAAVALVFAHDTGRRLNRALLRLVEDERQFQPLVTVRSAGFPMARIWKRSPSSPQESAAECPAVPRSRLEVTRLG